jgi:hypothetical protein
LAKKVPKLFFSKASSNIQQTLIIALATEGSTDHRFLPNIIQRTFERVAFEDHCSLD